MQWLFKMTDFVNINNAKLAYRLCGPDSAPLIITLHGGRGMGTGNVQNILRHALIIDNAQVTTDRISRHIAP